MSDMEKFLGKGVVDSINANIQLDQQMDGLKLINQRQINITQQEHISDQKAHIRELSETIASLKAENERLKRESSSATQVFPPDQARHLGIVQTFRPELDELVQMGYENWDVYKTFEQNLNDFELEKTKDELFENLLSRPFDEIALKSMAFQIRHEEQMGTLADWMVSQKAFKEVAIEYGARLGLTQSAVRKAANSKRLAVLNNRNDPRHQSNTTPFINRYTQKMIREHGEPTPFSRDFPGLVSAERVYSLNEGEATEWYEAFDSWYDLAERGNPQAQYNVGRCFDLGLGVDQNLDEAEKWYLKACDQNEPRSAHNLYLLYGNGDFARRDDEKSRQYLDLACGLQEKRALKVLDEAQQKIREQEAEKQRQTELERQAQEEREAAEAARIQKEKNALEARQLADKISVFKYGEPVPDEKIAQIKKLDPELGELMSFCYGLKIKTATSGHHNAGSFWNPNKVCNHHLTIESGTPNTSYRFYLSFKWTGSDYQKNGETCCTILLGGNSPYRRELRGIPESSVLSKVTLKPYLNEGNPFVIDLSR